MFIISSVCVIVDRKLWTLEDNNRDGIPRASNEEINLEIQPIHSEDVPKNALNTDESENEDIETETSVMLNNKA